MSEEEVDVKAGKVMRDYREARQTMAVLQSDARRTAERLRAIAAALDPQRVNPYVPQTNPFPSATATEQLLTEFPEGETVHALFNGLRSTFEAKSRAAGYLKELGLQVSE